MRKYLSLFLTFVVILSGAFSYPVKATIDSDIQNQQNQLNQNRTEQERLRKALLDAQNQARTLANQIIYIDNQINLSELEISEAQSEIQSKEEEIIRLGKNINSVSDGISETSQSIVELTGLLQSRIRSSYITNQTLNGPNLSLYLANVTNIQDLVSRYKYFKVVELHDKKTLDELEIAKVKLENEKKELETKKQTVQSLKESLQQQKASLEIDINSLTDQKNNKSYLLRITENNESVYQETLSAIKSEQQNLQSALNQLLSQIGNPGNATQVKKGQIIGIQGNSGMAFGDHVHFGLYSYTEQDFVSRNYSLCTRHLDPASYLNSGEFAWPVHPDLDSIPSLSDFNSSDDYYCSQGVCQVYGQTNFALAYAWLYCPYGFHNGIDMDGPIGTPVYAAADGVAYTIRLGQAQGNGVFIFHANGLMTLYWHLR